MMDTTTERTTTERRTDMIPWNYESQHAQRRADLQRLAAPRRTVARGLSNWRIRRPYLHKGSD
jgi:hypothetical protein